MPAAHSQLSPIRMNVTKVEKKDRTTTYRSTSGQYRQQQVDITVHYNVELTNFSSSPLSDVQIKWAVLVDTARATARGGGISTSSGKLEVVEGERTGSLGVGQKYVFDTDPIDLNTARTDMTYDGRVWKYGVMSTVIPSSCWPTARKSAQNPNPTTPAKRSAS